jgi:hypothetical protein
MSAFTGSVLPCRETGALLFCFDFGFFFLAMILSTFLTGA